MPILNIILFKISFLLFNASIFTTIKYKIDKYKSNNAIIRYIYESFDNVHSHKNYSIVYKLDSFDIDYNLTNLPFNVSYPIDYNKYLSLQHGINIGHGNHVSILNDDDNLHMFEKIRPDLLYNHLAMIHNDISDIYNYFSYNISDKTVYNYFSKMKNGKIIDPFIYNKYGSVVFRKIKKEDVFRMKLMRYFKIMSNYYSFAYMDFKDEFLLKMIIYDMHNLKPLNDYELFRYNFIETSFYWPHYTIEDIDDYYYSTYQNELSFLLEEGIEKYFKINEKFDYIKTTNEGYFNKIPFNNYYNKTNNNLEENYNNNLDDNNKIVSNDVEAISEITKDSTVGINHEEKEEKSKISSNAIFVNTIYDNLKIIEKNKDNIKLNNKLFFEYYADLSNMPYFEDSIELDKIHIHIEFVKRSRSKIEETLKLSDNIFSSLYYNLEYLKSSHDGIIFNKITNDFNLIKNNISSLIKRDLESEKYLFDDVVYNKINILNNDNRGILLDVFNNRFKRIEENRVAIENIIANNELLFKYVGNNLKYLEKFEYNIEKMEAMKDNTKESISFTENNHKNFLE